MDTTTKRKQYNRAHYLKRKLLKHDKDVLSKAENPDAEIETSSQVGENTDDIGLDWDFSSISDVSSDVHVTMTDSKDDLELDVEEPVGFNKFTPIYPSSKGVVSQITRRFISSLHCKAEDGIREEFKDVLGHRFTPDYYINVAREVDVTIFSLLNDLQKFVQVKSVFEGKSAYINYTYYNTNACKSNKRIDNVIKLSESCFGLIERFLDVHCQCLEECNCENLFVYVKLFNVENSKRLSFCKFRQKELLLDQHVLKPFSQVVPIKCYTYNADDFDYYVQLPNSEECE